MTADPDFFAKSANNSSPDPHVGLPSEEELTILIDQAAYYGADSRAVARDVLDLIRPAFEAKDAEIERLSKLPVIADYIEVQEARRATEAKLAQAVEALENATAFDLGHEIMVESRGKGTWVVKNFSSVLNTDGVWEWEPRPSSRDDAFISRTRFSRDEAFDRARTASAAARGET